MIIPNIDTKQRILFISLWTRNSLTFIQPNFLWYWPKQSGATRRQVVNVFLQDQYTLWVTPTSRPKQEKLTQLIWSHYKRSETDSVACVCVWVGDFFYRKHNFSKLQVNEHRRISFTTISFAIQRHVRQAIHLKL